MERSRLEAEAEAALRKKNDALREMMAQMEAKKKIEVKIGGDEAALNKASGGMQHAIKALEQDDILAKGNQALKDKKDREEAKGDAKPKAAVDVAKVLQATNVANETEEARKAKLEAYKTNLIQQRVNERKEEAKKEGAGGDGLDDLEE